MLHIRKWRVINFARMRRTPLSAKMKKKLVALWSDVSFPGSFSGLRNFQAALKFEKNFDFSIDQIREALRDHPNYLMHIPSRKHFPRRTYNSVHGYGNLFEADLAQMPKYQGYIYILGWLILPCSGISVIDNIMLAWTSNINPVLSKQ